MKFINLLIYSNLAMICMSSCSAPPWMSNIIFSDEKLEFKFLNTSSKPQSDGFLGSSDLFPEGSLEETQSEIIKQKITSSYNVTIPYPILASDLNHLLKGKLKNKGQAIIDVGKKYKICPLFLAAICCHESDNGTSTFAQKYNNVTGQMQLDKSSKKWTPVKFASVDACLVRTASNLKENYIKSGRVSISKIQAKYCPIITNKNNKDYNDPRGVNKYWTSGVTKWMSKI